MGDVPFNVQSMTIGKLRLTDPLKNISTDRMLMPASRKKSKIINDYSEQSTIIF